MVAQQVLRTHAGDTDEAQTPVIEHMRTGAPLYPVTQVPLLLDPAFVAGHAAFLNDDSAEQEIGWQVPMTVVFQLPFASHGRCGEP